MPSSEAFLANCHNFVHIGTSIIRHNGKTQSLELNQDLETEKNVLIILFEFLPQQRGTRLIFCDETEKQDFLKS